MRTASAVCVVVALMAGVIASGAAQADDEGLDATAGFFFKIPLNKDLQVDRSQEAEFGLNLGSKTIQKNRNKVTYQSSLKPRGRAGWEALSLRLGDEGVPELSLAGREAANGFDQGLNLADGWSGATASAGQGAAGANGINLELSSTTLGGQGVTGTPSRFHPRLREGITIYSAQPSGGRAQ